MNQRPVNGSLFQNSRTEKSIVQKLHNLKELCKKGFVVLHQDKNDKRKQRIFLTDKAHKMGEHYSQKEKAFMELLYKGISEDEIRTVYKIISRMEKNLINNKNS